MLEVTELYVSYGGAVRALQGVSLQVPDKKVVAVLGGNGAGKSTAGTERAAVRRIGQPEDIAAVIAFLASPDSGFVTGQTIYATGSPAV